MYGERASSLVLNVQLEPSNTMGTAMGKNSSNFLDALPTQGTLHVVMLGLDSAGKTTALYRLKFDQYLNTVPTIGFNCEKVQGTVGKAKGVQFLVWDVGGQEKLRPLWRSYTRCTDGILFVVDSVDVERMEEAKMELMRTTKCPDNQGVPVLILANKQDLPGARDPKELEKLLGLQELLFPAINLSSISSSSTGNIVNCTSFSNSADSCNSSKTHECCLTPSSQHTKIFGYGSSVPAYSRNKKELNIQFPKLSESANTSFSSTSSIEHDTISSSMRGEINKKQKKSKEFMYSGSSPSSTVTTPTAQTGSSTFLANKFISNSSVISSSQPFKGWYIQPACAITGEGLQEGLEALYEMITKRRKLNKAYKKKR